MARYEPTQGVTVTQKPLSTCLPWLSLGKVQYSSLCLLFFCWCCLKTIIFCRCHLKIFNFKILAKKSLMSAGPHTCHEIENTDSFKSSKFLPRLSSSWITSLVGPPPLNRRTYFSVPCHLCPHQRDTSLVHPPCAWSCVRTGHDALLSPVWWQLGPRSR